MVEAALYEVKRNGQTTQYFDHWGNSTLFRELLWGPEDFESWVVKHPVHQAPDQEISAVALVDFDRQLLTWYSETDALLVPKRLWLYERLLQQAWLGFKIERLTLGSGDHLIAQPGNPPADLTSAPAERAERVLTAARYQPHASVEVISPEQELPFDDDELRAWVTLIDENGQVSHRYLERLSIDLLSLAPDAIQTLGQLNEAQPPREDQTDEGMWIDQPTGTIGLWGDSSVECKLRTLQAQETGPWKLVWAADGYRRQCEVSGVPGQPLGESEALAEFLPAILSTEMFDPQAVILKFGASLRRSAAKTGGCLLVVIGLPLLCFSILSGDWKTLGVSLLLTAVFIGGGYKLLDMHIRRTFRDTLSADDQQPRPPACGPLDPRQRRLHLDSLLAAAGLPPIPRPQDDA